MNESPETQDASDTAVVDPNEIDLSNEAGAGAPEVEPPREEEDDEARSDASDDEALEDATPVLGGAADMGEPMTPMDETLQVGVDVSAGQDVAESGPAVLQDPADEEPLPSTVDAIGTGPTDAVTVQVEAEEPLPGVELGGEESLAMTDVTDATDDGARDEAPSAIASDSSPPSSTPGSGSSASTCTVTASVGPVPIASTVEGNGSSSAGSCRTAGPLSATS